MYIQIVESYILFFSLKNKQILVTKVKSETIRKVFSKPSRCDLQSVAISLIPARKRSRKF